MMNGILDHIDEKKNSHLHVQPSDSAAWGHAQGPHGQVIESRKLLEGFE